MNGFWGPSNEVFALSVAALLLGSPVHAQVPSLAVPPGTSPTPTTEGSRASGGVAPSCVERIPEGKAPPRIKETFPSHGKSGHQAVLLVEIEHGPGERVLPSALHVDASTPEFRALESAGFRFPDTKGPASPSLQRADEQGLKSTRFRLPLLLLPHSPGQHELVLPSLPIAVARASGEIITLCSSPHTILVDDPIANEPHAKPKTNPAPGRQEELWETLRTLVYGGGIGLVVATLVVFFLRAWLARPRKAPPKPPPRPPWEVALEALHDIRQARLIEAGRFGEHFDRVSHVLRRYLGDRYGFDALECTTSEILMALGRKAVRATESTELSRFLEESDLVKFAKQVPNEAQCHWLWQSAESVVKQTLPPSTPKVPGEPGSLGSGGLS